MFYLIAFGILSVFSEMCLKCDRDQLNPWPNGEEGRHRSHDALKRAHESEHNIMFFCHPDSIAAYVNLLKWVS